MNMTSGTAHILKNNAALGTNFTAMGSGASNTTVGRIYGNITTNFTPSANYARDTAFLGYNTTYSYNPYPTFTSVTRTDSATGRDGADKTFAEFAAATTWQASNMLNFGTSVWDFGGISRGYPALAGAGGQQ